MTDIAMERLRRKLARRDAKIEGMKRKIASLETTLSIVSSQTTRLPIDVEHAVQRALCNVRMIPMLGISGSDRIVEITSTVKPRVPKP